MRKNVVILIAEDDEGHAELIKKNIKRSGISNKVFHFRDGQEILDFLFTRGEGPHIAEEKRYILLLDIQMPKVDGFQVLKAIKEDNHLKRMPVFVISTNDDQGDVEKFYTLGCSNYVTKPVDYKLFVETIYQLGHFLNMVEIPMIAEVPGGITSNSV